MVDAKEILGTDYRNFISSVVNFKINFGGNGGPVVITGLECHCNYIVNSQNTISACQSQVITHI